jgi:hypothetical protein
MFMCESHEHKWIDKLNNIDPTPWNQAILLGAAVFLMICLAVFGSFVD